MRIVISTLCLVVVTSIVSAQDAKKAGSIEPAAVNLGRPVDFEKDIQPGESCALDREGRGVVNTMVETMYDASGVGLAAPQVGVQKRLFTYDVGEGPQVVFNPEVAETEGEWTYEEGCLSIPGFHFEIVRPKLVTITGIDIDGNDVTIQGDELLGRVFLHELDHLDGVLMLERLEPDERRQAMIALRDADLAAASRERLDDIRRL